MIICYIDITHSTQLLPTLRTDSTLSRGGLIGLEHICRITDPNHISRDTMFGVDYINLDAHPL